MMVSGYPPETTARTVPAWSLRTGRPTSRTPGRPTTWGTTPDFLEMFGLDSLADLPGVDELKASGLLDTRPAGTIIGDSGEMYNDAEAEGAPDDEEPEALGDGDDVGATETVASAAEGENLAGSLKTEAVAEGEDEEDRETQVG